MKNPALLSPALHRVRLLLFALCAYSFTVESVQCAPLETILDKRVLSSEGCSQLISSDWWQTIHRIPTDFDQQLRGCQFGNVNTPGAYNANRARNLAACKHYAEAIGEWTRAIDSYDDDNNSPSGLGLEPGWLISRARLYLDIGRPDDALADIERSLTLKRAYDQSKFSAALLLAEMGKYSRAEAVSPEPNSGPPYFAPYYSYLRGVLQEHQGKKELAKQNFENAARLFAASSAAEAAQSCLDAIAKIDKPTANTIVTMAKISAPKSNYENILRLLKALASRPDLFDLEVLKKLVGATSFKEIETGYLVMPYRGHFKELSLVTIDKLKSGGKKLSIHMQPELCSISKTEIIGLLKNPVPVSNTWRKEVVESEGFKVPSGTLVLNSRKGPFNPIWVIQLYSNDATYPETVNKPIVADDKAARSRHTLHEVISALEYGDFKNAQPAITELLSVDSEDPRLNMYQAEIYFKNGKLNEALASIDTAIKYGDRDKLLNDRYSGNVLVIHKGTYLLEQGKFEEANKAFEQALPAKASADQLVLRARAEIGLKLFTRAAKDLREASTKYYDEGRIVKRDETDKLLASIHGNVSTTELTSIAAIPAIQKKRADKMDSERAETAIIMRRVSDEKRQRTDEKLQRERKSVEQVAGALTVATAFKHSDPSAYLLALLNMSATAARFGQKEVAQNYWDKALAFYDGYTPKIDSDFGTRVLIANLTEFEGLQFQQRFDRLARRSELFCRNEKFKRERDESFINLFGGGEALEALLEKLIAIREELQPNTGIASTSLSARLPKSYKGKGANKELLTFIQLRSRFQPINSPSAETGSLLTAVSQILVKVDKVFISFERNDTTETKRLIGEIEQLPRDKTCPLSFHNALLYSAFIAIATGYEEQSKFELADECLRKAIATKVDITADFDSVRKLLSKVRIHYEKTKQFARAESLYNDILEKLPTTSIKDPTAIWDIKMALAEILLNHGRYLNEQGPVAVARHVANLKLRADQLFGDCIKVQTNEVKAGSSLEDMQLRRTIATKYPALIKLDLPNGSVVYRVIDRPGSRCGGICDGRRMDIEAPYNITVTGKGNGRLSISLSGMSLLDLALVQQDKGQLLAAQSLLVAALRADPTSEGFGILGECWYLQGAKEDALQAASLAVELDASNAHAAAIQRLCRRDLNVSSEPYAAVDSLLQTVSAGNSSSQPITRALALIALSKSADAVPILTKILKNAPESYRAATFKAACVGSD